ncbi:MAG: hypothetical protein RMK89_14455 [Armatimonadota bacterium]|nr:hypothetical protein [Armatimonadota bacterium]MDW8144647.1 hypothetical protein [Armatimonadota bacterium]
MFETFNPILLDTLEEGIVLFDNGEFAIMRETFRQRLNQGSLLRTNSGWRILANAPVVGTGEACPKKFAKKN